MTTQPDYHTVVVGAGFSGIGAAIKLDEAGLGEYLLIEAGDGAGGTWHWNTYPGIAVDIPSFSYQFSFEQRPDWSRTYAPGKELKAYAEHCVDKYGIRPKIRFNTKVLAADYDDEHALWRVQTDPGGVVTARFLINASGVLTTPKLPDIDGVDSFDGVTMHTARWDHQQDLTGKRVAVIGTGASAVQVIPEIAPIVSHLTVFQRTPIWCFPKFDVPLPAPVRWAMRLPGGRAVHRLASQAFVEATFPIPAQYFTVFPMAKWMERAGRNYLRRQVKDPVLREKLTPDYAVGCKRPGFHNTYLATYNRDNVRLVTEPIDKITPTGVATTDGESHDIDVLVLATGFKVMDIDSVPTFAVTGSGGRSLSAFWDEHRLQAYEGVSIPGFPNLFSVFGPYGYVGSSYFALIEAQTHHIVRCLKAARRRNATRVEVTEQANDRYFAEMMRRRHRQVFWQDSCRRANSYYFDKHGDVPLRPTTTLEAYWRSRRFDLDDYRFSA
ncbi:flavin-containing monooxygenase [Mycobacterium shimoidei]|uniref:Putative monooxygenase [Mycobacterium tuberculosis H37Rv] n=1 Tax=Mycobacterium shimoidei TaxID=29313 RepID=A0A1E3TCJ4_MYCSH|nr:NAD(P)/FAD-dependent oxidoreductase [Mycobacterium shimoidei]MCV7258188.1 NAD(P)/FAD-dependent oxidoreductase [Mycobacterium shimoidei]ODR12147.1 monooxygenase [Mycobacterium shimoidei]ORW82302.1 monooxygenase [Mycobacterium shimoidei]SRX95571.1 putative monooxygenase [Mycobacterium tuberculosis H37Rv] [Mycobacterium shimoidei]